MSLANILSLIADAAPVLLVFIIGVIVFQAIMSRDIKHLKELLSNHITDTNKKIDKLENSFKAEINSQTVKIDKLEASFKTEIKEIRADFKTELKEIKNNQASFEKDVSSKFDKVLERLPKKT